jgi:hypothetical protein
VEFVMMTAAEWYKVFCSFGTEPFVGSVVKVDGGAETDKALLRQSGPSVLFLQLLPVL